MFCGVRRGRGAIPATSVRAVGTLQTETHSPNNSEMTDAQNRVYMNAL